MFGLDDVSCGSEVAAAGAALGEFTNRLAKFAQAGADFLDRRVFGAFLGVLFLGLSLFFCGFAVYEDPAFLVGALAICPVGYGLLQAGFHARIEWSPQGVVFRRVWVTRRLPWEAMTRFVGGFGDVAAGRPEVGSLPISSSYVQLAIFDHLGHRLLPAARTTQLLNEYREHMPPASPGAHVTTTPTRPGPLGIVWLVIQGVLLVGTVLLIVTG